MKKWQERACEANAVIEDEGLEEYFWSEDKELHYGEQLTRDEQQDINLLLAKFPEITKGTPGRTHKATHKIRTLEAIPVRQKPYRIPQAYRKVMKELEEMENNGIIEKSESEWASPMVIVKKKDGGVRLCVDYMGLNAVTKFDVYPMPRIEELLDKVGDAKFISTMDLAKGYWQVPLNDEDKEKTAFSTPNGLFQFITMPFGLSGVPATFQRMMDNVLRGTDDYAGVYLDDIVIYETHLEHLGRIFQRLKEGNLTIKTAKCVFGTEDCI